jgi:hypothetical protein
LKPWREAAEEAEMEAARARNVDGRMLEIDEDRLFVEQREVMRESSRIRACHALSFVTQGIIKLECDGEWANDLSECGRRRKRNKKDDGEKGARVATSELSSSLSSVDEVEWKERGRQSGRLSAPLFTGKARVPYSQSGMVVSVSFCLGLARLFRGPGQWEDGGTESEVETSGRGLLCASILPILCLL